MIGKISRRRPRLKIEVFGLIERQHRFVDSAKMKLATGDDVKSLNGLYENFVKSMAKMVRVIQAFLPRAIVSICGLSVFLLGMMTIGWVTIPIYIVLLMLVSIIYEKHFKKDNHIKKNKRIRR